MTLILLRAVMILGIIMCGLLDIRAVGAIPIICILCYTAIGVRSAHGQPERLEALGTQVFFTAYSATIAAFAGMLLRTHLRGRTPESADALWLMAALGILCTVLGLLIMTTLHDIVSNTRRPELPQAPAVQAATAIEVVGAAALRDAYAAAVRELQALARDSATAVRDLTGEVNGLTAAIHDLSTCATDAADAGAVIRDTTRELKGIMDAFVQNLTIRIDATFPDERVQ